MVAPTPVSSLLHSSTLVICGLILCFWLRSSIIVLLVVSLLFGFGFLFSCLFSLGWAMIKGILSSDIKGIIAFSTISQLSYMFIGVVVLPIACLFHIGVHALFK